MAEKLAANVARDRDTEDRLTAAGWTVVRVWEHEDPVSAADRVQTVLETAELVDGQPRTAVRSTRSISSRSPAALPSSVVSNASTSPS